MPRREGDESPEPEGGRAAERLRQFREAREPTASEEDQDAEQTAQDEGTRGADEEGAE